MRFATGDGDPAKRRPSAVLALDFDYEDDVDQLCMGWDDLENSERVIATRCFEDRDPYDAQIYWKIL